MKDINKIFLIALLLSLIFSVAAVSAQEDITFNQSNLGETSDINLDVDDDLNYLELWSSRILTSRAVDANASRITVLSPLNQRFIKFLL